MSAALRPGFAARLRGGALAALFALSAAPALSGEFKAGDLAIDDPWSRATPKGADVAAGYLVVHNHGATPDRLLGGAADFAEDVSVHEMSMDGGVMKMRALPSGLEIPAGGEVKLGPSGFHIMFTGLKRQLKKGENVPVALSFERAGKVAVLFHVEGVGASGPGGAAKPAEDMKGMKM
jgi:copper(I)-binding protein